MKVDQCLLICQAFSLLKYTLEGSLLQHIILSRDCDPQGEIQLSLYMEQFHKQTIVFPDPHNYWLVTVEQTMHQISIPSLREFMDCNTQ